MKAIGRTALAFADGHLPSSHHGDEPDFVNADKLCVLHASDKDAGVEITNFFAEAEAVEPYRRQVCAHRVRHVRLNALIDSQALPVAEPYPAVINASVPARLQATRRNSGQAQNALRTAIAFPSDA